MGKSGGGGLQTLALRAITDEDKGDVVSRKFPRGGEQRVPRAIEAEIPGVQENKFGIASNGLDDLLIERRVGSFSREIGTVANNDNMRGIDAFAEDAVAHVVAERDNASGVAQCPAVQLFPEAGQHARGNNGASQGHIGIQISDVVDVGLAFQQGDEGTDDALEGRVGHGQNDIAGKKQGARNRQENVAQVIEHAFFHLQAGEIRGAGADDPHAPGILGLIKTPRPAIRGIVRRASAENRHIVFFG